MVFFTCNNCGESLKKAGVEKHYLQKRCRDATKNISCMDCQKDFLGEAYLAHTKCITEKEKYSGKDYVHIEPKNSNAKKQESWINIVRSILDNNEYNLSAPVRNAFERLQHHENVPRKKSKFENFVGNCIRMPKQQAAQVWDILEKELNKMNAARKAEVAASIEAKRQQNGTKRAAENGQKDEEEEEQPPQKKKAKIVKAEEEPTAAVEEETNETVTTDEFQWSDVLAKIIAKHDDGIALEKLKKKLLKKYTKKLALETLTDKQTKKFDKKFSKQLKKCPNLHVDNDLVKAC